MQRYYRGHKSVQTVMIKHTTLPEIACLSQQASAALRGKAWHLNHQI